LDSSGREPFFNACPADISPLVGIYFSARSLAVLAAALKLSDLRMVRPGTGIGMSVASLMVDDRHVFTDREFTKSKEQKGGEQMIGTVRKQTTSGAADKLENSPAAIRDINDLYLMDETQSPIKETRMTTLDEINRAAPDTPVFVLHVYDRAVLNGAALRAVLAKGPKLSKENQMNSTRHFMRELNRFAVTSAIDAGRGFQNYLDDYAVIQELHKRHKPRVTSLLWASSICFGIAALFLVALIRELL